MDDEHDQLDEDLANLAISVRSGDHMLACLQLAEFARKLDHCIRREEMVIASAYLQVHNEHVTLRRLIGLIANALDGADDRRGLELIGKLRSVLLLHLAKEDLLHLNLRLTSPPAVLA